MVDGEQSDYSYGNKVSPLTLAMTWFRVRAVTVAVPDAAKYGTSTCLSRGNNGGYEK